MIGPSTRRALNVRALRTALWLENWQKRLFDEAKNQNVDLFRGAQPDTKTIALNAYDVENLITSMRLHAAELRRYARHPKTSARRSPRGFTP
jgi:hypothetical protein